MKRVNIISPLLISISKSAVIFFAFFEYAVATEIYECFLDGSVYGEVSYGIDEDNIDYAEFELKMVSHGAGGNTTVEFCDEALDIELRENSLMTIRINKPNKKDLTKAVSVKLLWKRVEYGCPSGWCYMDGFSLLEIDHLGPCNVAHSNLVEE